MEAPNHRNNIIYIRRSAISSSNLQTTSKVQLTMTLVFLTIPSVLNKKHAFLKSINGVQSSDVVCLAAD